jgi:hypothetical protein
MFCLTHPAENHTKKSLLIIHNFLIDQYQLYLRLSSFIEASKLVPQPSAQVTIHQNAVTASKIGLM